MFFVAHPSETGNSVEDGVAGREVTALIRRVERSAEVDQVPVGAGDFGAGQVGSAEVGFADFFRGSE